MLYHEQRCPEQCEFLMKRLTEVPMSVSNFEVDSFLDLRDSSTITMVLIGIRKDLDQLPVVYS